MNKKILTAAAVCATLMVCCAPMETKAAGTSTVKVLGTSTTKKVKYGWNKINKAYYFYDRNGNLKTGWIVYKGKRYYASPTTGKRLVGWQVISGKKYYFNGLTGAMLKSSMWKLGGKRYYFKSNGTLYTSCWKAVKGKRYYFGKDGAAYSGWWKPTKYYYYFDPDENNRVTGWQTIDGKRYYFNKFEDKTRPFGAMCVGLVTISGSQYFFGSDGVQITDDFSSNGNIYTFDAKGRCTVTPIPVNTGSGGGSSSSGGLSDDFIFFTVYESGKSDDFYEGYNQTGGDNGNACGKYQFDYRYSLLPFVKYCYAKDPVTFAEFKPYASLTSLQKTKLKSNKEFYAAWNAIYKKAKITFANYQDAYAKQEYYDATEKYLLKYGIDISKRPDIIKGVVFSCSIQCGQLTAANLIKAAGVTNSTKDYDFITKVYNYRIKKYPSYSTRYRIERTEALRRLSLIS